MSIYSTNRTGSMALAQVVANESYNSQDFGRIMYETQVNDMAFFEAVLACDFNEIKGLREGTLLESEIAALNEASFKSIVEKLCENLKSFWGKLKAAFQNAIDKIAAYALNDGKAFVKVFDSKVGNKAASWTGKVEDVLVYNLDHKCFQIPDGNTVSGWMKKLQSSSDNVNAAEIVGWELAEKVGASQPIGVKEFAKKAQNATFRKEALDAGKINEYKKVVSNASSAVATLKKNQRDAEKSINDTMKELRNAAKGTDDEKNSIIKLNSLVSAYQTYVSVVAKVGIQVVRNDMKSRRVVLTKAMNDIVKNSKELNEATVLETADEFDDAMNNDLNLDAETQAAVDELVNSAE